MKKMFIVLSVLFNIVPSIVMEINLVYKNKHEIKLSMFTEKHKKNARYSLEAIINEHIEKDLVLNFGLSMSW